MIVTGALWHTNVFVCNTLTPIELSLSLTTDYRSHRRPSRSRPFRQMHRDDLVHAHDTLEASCDVVPVICAGARFPMESHLKTTCARTWFHLFTSFRAILNPSFFIHVLVSASDLRHPRKQSVHENEGRTDIISPRLKIRRNYDKKRFYSNDSLSASTYQRESCYCFRPTSCVLLLEPQCVYLKTDCGTVSLCLLKLRVLFLPVCSFFGCFDKCDSPKTCPQVRYFPPGANCRCR